MATLDGLAPLENPVCQDKMAAKDQGDRWDLKVELHTLGQQKPLTEKCAELQKTMGMVFSPCQSR